MYRPFIIRINHILTTKKPNKKVKYYKGINRTPIFQKSLFFVYKNKAF